MDIKKQSVGTEDFEKNILSKAVYIDKTSYLTELYGEHVHSNGMSYVDEVLLFTLRISLNLIMPILKINPSLSNYSIILLYLGIKPSVKNTWGSFLLLVSP